MVAVAIASQCKKRRLRSSHSALPDAWKCRNIVPDGRNTTWANKAEAITNARKATLPSEFLPPFDALSFEANHEEHEWRSHQNKPAKVLPQRAYGSGWPSEVQLGKTVRPAELLEQREWIPPLGSVHHSGADCAYELRHPHVHGQPKAKIHEKRRVPAAAKSMVVRSV